MAKEQEAKPKKKRTKRMTIILELTKDDEGNYDVYSKLSGFFESAAEATKWVRENGEKLKGKTITIASITPHKKVEIETKSVVKF